MCYEFWQFGKKAKDEERARTEADRAIQKARSEGKPKKPLTPAEQPPVTADEPATTT